MLSLSVFSHFLIYRCQLYRNLDESCMIPAYMEASLIRESYHASQLEKYKPKWKICKKRPRTDQFELKRGVTLSPIPSDCTLLNTSKNVFVHQDLITFKLQASSTFK